MQNTCGLSLSKKKNICPGSSRDCQFSKSAPLGSAKNENTMDSLYKKEKIMRAQKCIKEKLAPEKLAAEKAATERIAAEEAAAF
jgi:hypothetical protein